MAHERSNDYELLYMIYQMDEYSLKQFIIKYQKYMRKIFSQFRAYSYLLPYIDDIFAEGIKILYQSIYAFRDDGTASFSTFYYCVFRNRLISLLYEYHHNLHQTRGQVMDLDRVVEDNMCLRDQIRNRNETLEGVYFFQIDAYERTLRKVFYHLRPVEKEIILLRVDGFSYTDIAKKLKIDVKKVDNTLKKVRNIKV